MDVYEKLFPALITDKATVSGSASSGAPLTAYTFVEQTPDPVTGEFSEADSARTGTAYEVNNSDVPVGTYAVMRFRGIIDGSPVWDFEHCCTGGSSGGSSGSGSSGSR